MRYPLLISDDVINIDIMYQTYLNLNPVLEKHNMSIGIVNYIGNQWVITLDNNLIIKLGVDHLLMKLNKFMASLNQLPPIQSMQYVDMRYIDGFSIKYKK